MIESVITSYYLKAFKSDLALACKKMKVDYDLVVGEKRIIGKIPVGDCFDSNTFSSFADVWGYDVTINIPEIDKMTETGYEYLGCIKDDGIVTVHPTDNTDFDLSTMEQIKNFPCDRCGRNHSRNIIHVFRKDGKVTVYGSTCAKTKFGIDVNSLIAKFTKIKEQFGFNDFEEMGNYGGFGKDWRYIRADVFVPMAFFEVVEHGYVSATKVYNEGGVSTTDLVLSDYYEMIDGNNTIRKEFDYNTKNIDFDFKAFISWVVPFVDGLDDGDFKFNMKSAVSALEEGYVHPRTKGFVTYMAFKYWFDNVKAKDERKKVEFNTDYSEFELKERLREIPVEIINEYTFDTRFGVCIIWTFRGLEDNRKYKWITGNGIDRDADKILLTGTIKQFENHEKYGKAIQLTRCKIDYP